MDRTIDYHRRVNAVTNYVAANLSKSYTIEELAAVAHFSKFHFHRVFHALTGETVAGMVNRLRLEGAAETLIYRKNLSITQVAVDHGYSSGANFTKAFTKHFGCPPSVYRLNNSRDPKLSKNGKDILVAESDSWALDQHVDIANQPEVELAYRRQIGAYNHREISRMHAEVQNWVNERDCEARERSSIGITWSDSHIAAEERWRYDACVAVRMGTKGDGQIAIQKLPGSLVAQLKVSLEVNDGHDLSLYWNWFLGRWLPNNPYELNASPSYELYEGTDTKGRFVVRLCLPVVSHKLEFTYAK